MSNSTKAARKAAAQAELARARQWANERRGAKSTSPNRSKHFAHSSDERDLPSVAATRRSMFTAPDSPTSKRKTPENDPTGQYRKTPSRESRTEALAQARSKAQEWSIERKRKMGIAGDALFMVVPETEEDEDDVVTETWSECDDDFNTADNEPTDNASAEIVPTEVATSKAGKHDLILLRKHTKNVLERLQHISSENVDLIFIKNDIQNIYDRINHMSENAFDSEKPGVMDPKSDHLRHVISIILFAFFVHVIVRW